MKITKKGLINALLNYGSTATPEQTEELWQLVKANKGERAVSLFNELTALYGVERECGVTFANTGDSYFLTLCYHNNKLELTSWGDIVESPRGYWQTLENNLRLEAWGEWLRENFIKGYCSSAPYQNEVEHTEKAFKRNLKTQKAILEFISQVEEATGIYGQIEGQDQETGDPNSYYMNAYEAGKRARDIGFKFTQYSDLPKNKNRNHSAKPTRATA